MLVASLALAGGSQNRIDRVMLWLKSNISAEEGLPRLQEARL